MENQLQFVKGSERFELLLNISKEYWFKNPFSVNQVISWILLLISLWLVFAGLFTLKRHGKQKTNRKQEDLYTFENTSELVKSGIYKYIRHPMYSSLIFLSWGIYLKNPDWILLPAAIISSLFLVLTAFADERECIAYFGDEYIEYSLKTKRYIPFIF